MINRCRTRNNNKTSLETCGFNALNHKTQFNELEMCNFYYSKNVLQNISELHI